jgi:hypothetical protein
MKYLNPAQSNYLKGLVRMRGETTVSLAAKLGRPWSTIYGVINGNRANPEARQGIAAFLGMTVEELFLQQPPAEMVGGAGSDELAVNE